MSERWKDVGDLPPGIGPYAHWWQDFEAERLPDGLSLVEGVLVPDSLRRAVPGSQAGRAIEEQIYGGGVPLPQKAANPSGTFDEWGKGDLPLPKLDPGTVIVGIVDTGIALGHRRFRLADGATRFIAAWQQGADFGQQPELPCGQELFAGDIDRLLSEHSGGRLDGPLDEETFNRAAGLVAPGDVFGQRDLDHPGAHGTHVLDLAAGLDPATTHPAEQSRNRIIAVNLPAQHHHGSAGNFLAYYAIFAVDRIIYLAQAAWRFNNGDRPGGYPLVINFSYGMQAGPKDGTHAFERYLRQILRERTRGWPAPVRVVMPAGNDNLSRGAASAVMGPEGKKHHKSKYASRHCVALPWRVLPDDGTSNFVEIWTEAVDPEVLPEVLGSICLCVTPPDSAIDLTLGPLRAGGILQLDDCARVYCQTVPGEGSDLRVRLIVAALPTAPVGGAGTPQAPAGLWRLHLRYDGPPVDVSWFIQSDQSAVRYSKTGKRSHFDQENYRTHGPNGALSDSYRVSVGNRPVDAEPWDEYGPVQRKGTQNALSSINDDEILCIASYCSADGSPALFSSTSDGNWSKTSGREVFSASCPGEDALSLFGVLAAGARDGSVSAFRGTSMAAAQATRLVADALRHWNGAPKSTIGTKSWLMRAALARERQIEEQGIDDRWNGRRDWPKLHRLKMGIGRLAANPAIRVDRLGHD